jgi:hypothetical protein
MTPRLAALLCLACPLAFAGSWSGILVDSNCYASEERNVTKNYGTVEQDVNMEVRACIPKAHTKAFALILRDGDKLELDSAGNAKAAELVRNAAKRTLIRVTVTGDADKQVIKTSLIAAN